MSHLVLDSGRLAVHRFLDQRFKNREKLRNACKQAQSRDADAKSGDGVFSTDSVESVLGKPLHHTVLMKRLKSCNANLYFEVSTVTKRIGIYYPDGTAIGTPDAPRVRYLGMSIALGINPEFTPKFTKEDGTLKSPETGYRTVLARLLKQRFVTEPQIMKHFGLPGRTSFRWKMATT